MAVQHLSKSKTGAESPETGPTGRVWGISLPDGAQNWGFKPENGTDRQSFRQKTACRSGEGRRKGEGEKERKGERGREKEGGREKEREKERQSFEIGSFALIV